MKGQREKPGFVLVGRVRGRRGSNLHPLVLTRYFVDLLAARSYGTSMKNEGSADDSNRGHGARRRHTGANAGRLRSVSSRSRGTRVRALRYVYWQDGKFWLGYLEEFPDYMTQGESRTDLQEHLRDLYQELTSGQIPAVRRVAELEVA